MSNQPDRYEKFVVPEGVSKITFTRDTKVANAGTFTVQREDHTLGNLVRIQLLKDTSVLFVGYKVPHPLEYVMLIKVQTDGSKTPIQAVQEALRALASEAQSIYTSFQREVQASSADGF